VGDGGASCVVVWRGRKLSWDKEIGVPFGKKGIEAFERWRRSTDVRGEVMLELQLFTA